MRILVQTGEVWAPAEGRGYYNETELQGSLKDSPEVIASDAEISDGRMAWSREFSTADELRAVSNDAWRESDTRSVLPEGSWPI